MARRLKQNTPRSRTAACIKTEHREKKRMGILKQFRAGKLAVIICSDRKQLGLLAGADAAEAIRRAIAEKGEANVMFAAAPSQDDTLRALCADCTVDWSRVNAFHMDEYIGLAETHPAGFRTYLKNRVFNRFTFKSVNLINGNAADIDGENERYAHLLTAHPLDVVLLGIGENGHIAFNDPSVADFSDKAIVKRVKLEQICRKLLQQLSTRIQALDMQLHCTPAALKELCAQGYNPRYGARPLRRAVQRLIEDPAAEMILNGQLPPQSTLLCDYCEQDHQLHLSAAG